MQVSITLVEPEYPVNLGHVARILKNFGINDLYLVGPKVDLDVAEIYAAHGADIIRNARLTTFGEIRKLHDVLIGTTAIRARRKANVTRTMMNLEDSITYAKSARSASFVFGRDTTGLTNYELSECDAVTTIETGTRYASLNVSHAVGIVLYLLSRRIRRKVPIQSKVVRKQFARYAQLLALASGFQPHKMNMIQASAARIALKSGLGEKEMLLMLTLFRKALLALEKVAPRSYALSKT